MGLDTDYDCFNGPYSAFARFRNGLAEAAGYPLVDGERGPIYAVVNDERWRGINFMGEWDDPPEDPLLILLIHSDCDGHIAANHVPFVRARLEQLLPIIEAGEDPHAVRGLSLSEATRKFIDGLKEAEEEGESVGFH